MRVYARTPIAERLARHSTPEPNTGCWLWTASLRPDGYAQLGSKPAHRTSFETFVGAIPAGLCVCHRCDQPTCINPAHLFLGTHADNMADKVKKDRHVRGVRAKNHVITDDLVREIRLAVATGTFTQGEIADVIGVARETVNGIVNGRSWRHVVEVADSVEQAIAACEVAP